MDEGQCTVLLLLLPNLPSNFQHFLFPRGQGRSRGKYKGSQVPRSSSPKDLNFLQPGKKLPAFKKDYIMKYYSQQWILKVWNGVVFGQIYLQGLLLFVMIKTMPKLS